MTTHPKNGISGLGLPFALETYRLKDLLYADLYRLLSRVLPKVSSARLSRSLLVGRGLGVAVGERLGPSSV